MANTISEKLTYLSDTKRLIKEAITGKGVSVSESDTFRSYADKITSIQTGGGGTTNIPDGTKFGNSTFTTVPTELFPYLEAQTDLSSIFENCSSLQTVPLFDTSRVTIMDSMFYLCNSLTSVPLFDTSSVTTMDSMFYKCKELETVPLFDTSSVTNMSMMIYDCEKIQTVPLFDTSSVTTMGSMFSGCGIITVPQLDTSRVTYMGSMFNACRSLTSVSLFNVSKVTANWSMFNNCSSLTNLSGFTGLKINLDLSSSPLLTIESVMNVINNAADMSSNPKTLTLHKDVFNKLTQEQLATASAKGWNIASR